MELADILKALIEQFGEVGVLVVTLIVGSLSSTVTDWVKGITFPTEEDKQKALALVAEIFALLSSLGTALVLAGVAYLLGLVGDVSFAELFTGLTSLSWGGSKGWYLLKRWSK